MEGYKKRNKNKEKKRISDTFYYIKLLNTEMHFFYLLMFIILQMVRLFYTVISAF